MCLLEVLVRPQALGERGKAEAVGDGGVPASLAVVSASERNGARARRPAAGLRSGAIVSVTSRFDRRKPRPAEIYRKEGKGPTPRSLSRFCHVSENGSRKFSWFGQVCRHSESHESNHTFSAGRTAKSCIERGWRLALLRTAHVASPRPGLDSANRLTRVSILRPIKVHDCSTARLT